MGMWNETCMLSNLPILGGDEIVWLLLTDSPYEDRSGVGMHDFHFVRSIPLMGTYDTYGSIEVGPGQEFVLDNIEHQFSCDLIPRGLDDRGRVLDKAAVTFENYSFDNLTSWLHEGYVQVDKNYDERRSATELNDLIQQAEGRLKWSLWNTVCGYFWAAVQYLVTALPKVLSNKRRHEWSGYVNGKVLTHFPTWHHKRDVSKLGVETSHVGSVMIRRDVWDSLLEMDLGRITLAKYKEDADSYLAFMGSTGLSLKELGIPTNLFEKSFGFDSGGPAYGMRGEASRKRILDKAGGGGLSIFEAKAVLYQMCELAFIERVMRRTRRHWHLTTGSGSQQEEFLMSLEVHHRMSLVAKECIEAQADEALADVADGEDRDEWQKERIEELELELGMATAMLRSEV